MSQGENRPMNAPKVIDVHAHMNFDELLGMMGDMGPELRPCEQGSILRAGGYELPVSFESSVALDPKLRVDQLDSCGIDIQVMAPSPLWFFNHAPIDLAEPFIRKHNELLAEWCARTPERFRFFAELPTQDIGLAIKELERSVRELGALGPYVSTDLGYDLDDPILDEFYAAVVELDVPLMLHPGVTGIDSPMRDERLRRFLGDVILGYTFEETLAVIQLIYGRVLERHPKLDICLSHGGGASPFIYGRLHQYATGKLRWNPENDIAADLFDVYFQRLWFDSHVHHPAALTLLTTVANRDHLVLGTNFGGWDAEPEVDAGDPSLDLHGNAARLLRL
jgi:aminocarboxymuconate-semialdehyde decarboxylase